MGRLKHKKTMMGRTVIVNILMMLAVTTAAAQQTGKHPSTDKWPDGTLMDGWFMSTTMLWC